MMRVSNDTPGVALQLPTSPGAPSTHVPSRMQSAGRPSPHAFGPLPHLCACVGSGSEPAEVPG